MAKKIFRDPLGPPLQRLHDIQKILIGLNHPSGVLLTQDNELTESDSKQLKKLYHNLDQAIFDCIKADKTQLSSNPIIKERIEQAQKFSEREFFEGLSVAVKTGAPTLPTLEEIEIENAVIEGKDKGKSLQRIFNDLHSELVGDDFESFKKKVARNPNLKGIDRDPIASFKTTKQ